MGIIGCFKQIFKITQEMIDQVNNLAEVIETDLVRIVSISL